MDAVSRLVEVALASALTSVTAELAATKERLSVAEESLAHYKQAGNQGPTALPSPSPSVSLQDPPSLPTMKDLLQGAKATDLDFRGSVRSLLAAVGSRTALGVCAKQKQSQKPSETPKEVLLAEKKARLMFQIKAALSELASHPAEAFAETTTASFYIRLFVAAGFSRDRVLAEAGGYPASFTYVELQKLHGFMQTAGTIGLRCMEFVCMGVF